MLQCREHIVGGAAKSIAHPGEVPRAGLDGAHLLRYAMESFLGDSDEEFRLDGRAGRIDDPVLRDRVHAAIRFQFGVADPIYRLDIEGAMWGYWENAGKPGTRPIRKRWEASG